MTSPESHANGELLVEIRNHVATLTLNRPAALNALSFDMLEGMTALFNIWALDPNIHAIVAVGAGEKAFCAGGDVRGLYNSLINKNEHFHQQYFSVEYALNYRIHRFLKNTGKPYIAMIDGIVMGGGMGISQGATLRIAGERTRMAMPETAIGLFPDVGGSYFLSRAPGAIGLYLALTGTTIKAADALYAGLADLYMPPAAQQQFFMQLGQLHWTDNPLGDITTLTRSLATPPPEPDATSAQIAPLSALRPAIDLHFANQPSVQAIMTSLENEQRPLYGDWVKQTIELLKKRSPTMLCVAKRQIETAATMTLADCFRMELNMVQACFGSHDLIEGIRALLIDKDNAPRWNPASLTEVTPAMIDAFFRPHWAPSAHPLKDLEITLG